MYFNTKLNMSQLFFGKYSKGSIMGYVKGIDNKARTVKNSLEGQVGDIALDEGTFNKLAVYGNVTIGGYFSGNGYTLTSVNASNVSGTVANATYADTANTASTAGSVTANAQANITSLGTLTSLSVTGNTTVGNLTSNTLATLGNITAVRFAGNGRTLTSVVTTANTAYNVVNDTVASIDNISLKVAGNGLPQISAVTSNISTSWSVVAVLTGGNTTSTNTGGTANVGVWTNVGASTLGSSGDTITAVIQDQTGGHIYRGTFVQTAGAGNASVIIERMM